MTTYNLSRRLRIGTRGSPLALVQANLVRKSLETLLPGIQVEIQTIHTSGDHAPYIEKNISLQNLGGKGLFTKEVEEALLNNTVDIGVHSLKDMATIGPKGLLLGAILPRDDVRDAFVTMDGKSLEEIPEGSKIGTSSLRRTAQILYLRPDLQVIPLRGNVQTRLKKMATGECDGTVMALAGLNRMGLSGTLPLEILPLNSFLPAPAQGALAIQCREEDLEIRALLAPLNHEETDICVKAERALLHALDGNCRTPIAALGVIREGALTLEGLIAKEDGSEIQRDTILGAAQDWEHLGITLAGILKSK